MTLALIRTTCLRRAPSRCLASFHMTCFHKSTLAFTSMNQSVVTSPRITVSTSKSPWSGGGHHLSFSTSSSSSDLVQIDTDPDSGIATLTMTHGPVNSLSLEMCQALSNAIQTVESDKKLQVLLLKSSNPSIFSAGLDLLEMHQAPTKLPRLRDFWTSFQQLYLDLYGSRLACIAVIEGHAPAAGCMLALSCDYRIMKHTPKSTIGLNETKLGIVAPPFLGYQMIDTIGKRPAELALTLGTLFSPQEALQIGLVDRLVPMEEDMTAAAMEVAKDFLQIPPPARVASKLFIRQERLDNLVATREQDLQYFCDFVTNDKTQQSLAAYVASLAKKKKKE